MFTTDTTDTMPEDLIEQESIMFYFPIVRLVLILAAFYYVIMTIVHLTQLSGSILFFSASLSILTSIAALLCYRMLKDQEADCTLLDLEMGSLVANGLILILSLIHI